MSGHSKWANIKFKKGKADALRGKINTKIGREITIAVKMGGSDPTGNMRLKLALSKAKANNIPKENIKRAIAKGEGTTEGSNYEEITYEGYGPAGVAIMISALTDNRNRTAADVRHVFSKGGNMGESGCVSWMFKNKGLFTIEKEGAPAEDEVMEIALEAGAEDMETNDDTYVITTAPEDYDAVEQALADHNINVAMSELSLIPDNTIAVTGEDAEKVQKMIDSFDELDDVQDVCTNADLPDEE